MKLIDIKNYIQSVCQNISTVLDVDVTVVSKDLVRIAGTGIFKDKIDEKISDKSAYSNVLISGEPYTINREIEDSCKNCIHSKDCKELADICTPIKLGNNNIGILGIAAFTEEQKNKILSKDQELCEFISSMSNLISYKLDELYKEEIRTVEELEKEEIEKAIKKYGNNTQEMKQVAKALNIGIATLYRKVKKYNINAEEE
ncbi:MAG: helix-turn-helix domain-containing protein [Terrisporobacter othiniensis]|uniref:helix-turn-helix domain-containing protein n=1 Tax=Terrisporobacter petrolearius TaxID=1460447 RepID=UPI0008E28BE2|nr:helix-turn-helix domain-containing protein [Terrisporobacter petrolearius]MDU4862927.1 helix-turn-helix domain-containing protein [Terrisporobacter othiniensis]MDU6996887.1 helix-turn-helix domain-containing protein [Terrisporobacter othiniensis]UPA32030.1 Fis family transcriptional regulator [Terrisporobacter glycolicus]SFJ25147.1 regulatory protein, Fis family [Terrisporobacter glycolicus]